MSAERCPRCDDPICGVPDALAAADGIPGFGEVCSDADNAKWSALGAAYLECAKRPAVDWRARALAAESDAAKDLDDARSWRAAIEGAKEPGDPVLRAIAELLSCTYLDAVPTPADDDFRRELAVAARIANDERRTKLGEGPSTPSTRRDAAKWRKVEPLIERLRVAADEDTSDTIHVVDAAIDLLAATKEPS